MVVRPLTDSAANPATFAFSGHHSDKENRCTTRGSRSRIRHRVPFRDKRSRCTVRDPLSHLAARTIALSSAHLSAPLSRIARRTRHQIVRQRAGEFVAEGEMIALRVKRAFRAVSEVSCAREASSVPVVCALRK